MVGFHHREEVSNSLFQYPGDHHKELSGTIWDGWLLKFQLAHNPESPHFTPVERSKHLSQAIIQPKNLPDALVNRDESPIRHSRRHAEPRCLNLRAARVSTRQCSITLTWSTGSRSQIRPSERQTHASSSALG
jgi:hypothetical protein